MYKFYPDEVKKYAIEDYKAGMKVADIEEKYGITRGCLGHILTKAGVPRRRNRNAPQKNVRTAGGNRKNKPHVSAGGVALQF